MDTFDHCNWAVCTTTPGSTQDDGQDKRTVHAWFQYPFDAEEYILKLTPKETRDRFYVMHRSDIDKNHPKDNQEAFDMLSTLEEFFRYKSWHPEDLEPFQRLLFAMHTEADTLLRQWHYLTGCTNQN